MPICEMYINLTPLRHPVRLRQFLQAPAQQERATKELLGHPKETDRDLGGAGDGVD